MNVWVTAAISCEDCGSKAFAVFDHKPTKEEENSVSDSIGGMRCISVYTTKQEVKKLDTPDKNMMPFEYETKELL